MNAITRLTKKHQTTIPEAVRKALGLKAGDHVEFAVKGKSVVLKKAARRVSEQVLFNAMQSEAFSEWDSPDDDEAFREL